MKAQMSVLRYWLGRWWLRSGFCPACNSSPPHEACPVCDGAAHYGHEASPAVRADWRERWDSLRIALRGHW